MLIDLSVFDEQDILEFLENNDELTNNFDEALKLINEEEAKKKTIMSYYMNLYYVY